MSVHFTPREFACHSGDPYPAGWVDTRFKELTDCLEVIREKWTFPIVIVSGYRTEAYNKRIGGAALSQHVQGRAADIRAMRLSDLGKLNALIESLIKDGTLPTLGGYGLYPGWVHVDVREKVGTKIARWIGKGVGSEA